MRVNVRIAHPHRRENAVEFAAIVDAGQPVAQIPGDVALRLDLPRLEQLDSKSSKAGWQSYACFEYEGDLSISSALITNETSEVVIGLSTLTGLCREIDRRTGQPRKFEPLLL